ncbi:MAG: hypothetical protein ACFE92_08975 [Promethearchaeota archaeon]
MKYRKRNYIHIYTKILLIVLTISLIYIPLVFENSTFNSTNTGYNSNLKQSSFSKDDYTPILKEEKQALGNVTINNIDFTELEMGFYIYNTTYPLLWNDYYTNSLNLTQINIHFIETIETAIVDNLDDNIEDRSIITVKLNESLYVEYNNLTLGYLIYHSRLVPCDLVEFFIDNGTNITELTIDTDYSIDNDNFIVFNYETYFQEWSTSNFSMYLIWEYDLTLNDWRLSQNSKKNLIINEKIQNFTVDFNYNFILNGRQYDQSISESTIFANDIIIALTVNLPDKNSLNDHVLELNNVSVNINDHLINKTIKIFLTDDFNANQSLVSLNFTSSYILEFIEPLGETWAIDRLVEGRNTRERIYFASLINGPQHIYLKFVSFYEPTIYFDQVIKNYSLFERDFAYFYVNVSETGKEGIKISVPYLIAGETCPFIIKYASTQPLRIVVTDNIKMPLVGADLEIYYFGQKYGTFISSDHVQPISPGKSNENGEIKLNDVPNGNYTIRVYYNGIFLKESVVNTKNEINYVYTNYPHFPFWIIIFGSINGLILLFGVIFYLKNKKTR